MSIFVHSGERTQKHLIGITSVPHEGHSSEDVWQREREEGNSGAQ